MGCCGVYVFTIDAGNVTVTTATITTMMMLAQKIIFGTCVHKSNWCF